MADRDADESGTDRTVTTLPDTISDPGEEGGVDAPNEGDDEADESLSSRGEPSGALL